MQETIQQRAMWKLPLEHHSYVGRLREPRGEKAYQYLQISEGTVKIGWSQALASDAQ